MRSDQNERDFTAAATNLGLRNYESASWPSFSIKDGHATLEGTIHTRQGGSRPLVVELVKERGEWRVLAFHGPRAGAATDEK